MSPRFFFTTLFSALGAAGIVIFGSDAIEANVEPTISTEAKPMPVTVERFELETGYSASTRFLGIIEAASDSNIGFEVAGVLSELDAKEGDFVTTGSTARTAGHRPTKRRIGSGKSTRKRGCCTA